MVTELLGPFGNLLKNLLDWTDQRRQAEVQVASDLRQWMSLCDEFVCDIDTWQRSDGRGGSEHREVPELPFEKSKSLVAKLPKKTVVSILNLIQNKNDANAWIRGVEERSANDGDVIQIVSRSLAELFLQADPIHRGLANNIGWGLPSYYEEQVSRMQRELAAAKKADQEEAERDDWLFDEITPPPGSS